VAGKRAPIELSCWRTDKCGQSRLAPPSTQRVELEHGEDDASGQARDAGDDPPIPQLAGRKVTSRPPVLTEEEEATMSSTITRGVRRVQSRTRYTLASGFVRCAAAALRTFGGTYHPVLGGEGRRRNAARWEIIRAELARLRPGSVLDIGCAEGWFVRQAVEEFGCWGLGVEGKPERVLAGELHRLQAGLDRIAILRANLTPESIRRLPRVDVVLCLAVVQHVVSKRGMDYAVDFLTALQGVTDGALIYEFGAAYHPAFRADNGQGKPLSAEEWDPHIREMLGAAGFRQIEEIGRTHVYAREDRVVYRAVPIRVGAGQ
jgi:hypothetical protein